MISPPRARPHAIPRMTTCGPDQVERVFRRTITSPQCARPTRTVAVGVVNGATRRYTQALQTAYQLHEQPLALCRFGKLNNIAAVGPITRIPRCRRCTGDVSPHDRSCACRGATIRLARRGLSPRWFASRRLGDHDRDVPWLHRSSGLPAARFGSGCDDSSPRIGSETADRVSGLRYR